jgi:hypothetical protein
MTVSVIVNGVETSLDDGTLCRLIGHDGWGVPPNHRLTIRGPEQHGETDLGYRLDPKFGKLLLQFPDTDLPTMYAHRDQLRKLFRPQLNQTIKWVLPNGAVRYYDGHLSNDLSMPWDVNNWAAQSVTLSFKVESGYGYDPVAKVVAFNYGGGVSPFLIPYVIPYNIGVSTIDQVNTFTYNGEWLSYPILQVVGPITNFVITHQQTGYKLQAVSGLTINPGDYYFFDLRYGYKTVKDSSGVRQNIKLTQDSNLTQFFIGDDSSCPGGVNSIRVQGSGITGQTQVIATYYENYLGH